MKNLMRHNAAILANSSVSQSVLLAHQERDGDGVAQDAIAIKTAICVEVLMAATRDRRNP